MKRLLLVTLEYAPMKGGIARYYQGLADALGKGYIAVLTHADYEMTRDELASEDGVVIRTRMLAQSGICRWRKMIRPLLSALKQNKPEFLGVGQILPIGYLALLLKLIKGQKYIIFVHGMDLLQSRSVWYRSILTQWVISLADVVIANSQATTHTLTTRYRIKQERVKVVYPALGSLIVGADNHGNTSIEQIILSVCRLVPRKGIDMMIQAMPLILRVCPRSVYVVVGEGLDLDRLIDLAQQTQYTDDISGMSINLFESGKVVFAGALEQAELESWYRRCSVFALPVRENEFDMEGFGIVYLEAGFFGKPCVAGASGGAPEAVLDGETGLIVDPDNVPEIAKAVITLLQDPDYAEILGNQARARILKEFQWTKQAQTLLEHISNVV